MENRLYPFYFYACSRVSLMFYLLYYTLFLTPTKTATVDWNGVDVLHPDFGIISRPQTPSSGFVEVPTPGANSNQK